MVVVAAFWLLVGLVAVLVMIVASKRILENGCISLVAFLREYGV